MSDEKHPALEAAKAQASKDCPGCDKFTARIQTIDHEKFVVKVVCRKEGWDIFPIPVLEYVIARDLSSVTRSR
jgi:hypothetical protein